MYTENDNVMERERGNCGCGSSSPMPMPSMRVRCDGESLHDGWGLQGHPLASVYAPIQQWRNLYDKETALERGTIFSELDLPFICGGMTEGGKCNG